MSIERLIGHFVIQKGAYKPCPCFSQCNFFLLWRDCLTTTQQSMRHCITKVYIQRRIATAEGILWNWDFWFYSLCGISDFLHERIKLHCVLCDIPFSLCVGGPADSLSTLFSPSLLCVSHLRQFIHSHNISLSLMPLDLRLPDMRTKCVCVCVCVCVCGVCGVCVWCVCVCVCVVVWCCVCVCVCAPAFCSAWMPTERDLVLPGEVRCLKQGPLWQEPCPSWTPHRHNISASRSSTVSLMTHKLNTHRRKKEKLWRGQREEATVLGLECWYMSYFLPTEFKWLCIRAVCWDSSAKWGEDLEVRLSVWVWIVCVSACLSLIPLEVCVCLCQSQKEISVSLCVSRFDANFAGNFHQAIRGV